MALTRTGLAAMLGQWRRQTCAIERLIRRLEGRQVAVTGLGGSVISIVLGDYHACAVLVSGATPESKQGSPKVNFPSRQWFSKVKTGT